MSLQGISFKNSYQTPRDNVLRDFLVPALKEAVSYDRAVGFFSSGFLADITSGLYELVKNGGKIRLVVSPKLSEEDANAIAEGYKDRNSIEKVITANLLSQLKDPKNEFEECSLNILAGLIADGYMDIKVAFTEDESNVGMFHDKMGIIEDSLGNAVAFSGSMNETPNAFFHNYESIDVFCSWNYGEKKRVQDKKEIFEEIWNDSEPHLRCIHFPELDREIIRKYQRQKVNYSDPKIWPKLPPRHAPIQIQKSGFPIKPDWLNFHKYQDEAINTWAQKGFRGIFDMATGTGKTLTALGALTRLSDALEHKLMAIIVAPYQHLVDQWVTDIKAFGMKPIIGYSSSPQSDWLKRLRDAVMAYNCDPDNFCVFICTNATFKSPKVQELINTVKEDLCLIVDEAHNIGAEGSVDLLSETLYKYRLALSATLDRHHDTIGTQALYDFFGDKCIEYPIERAIEEGFLTPYEYHPVITYLDDLELAKYDELTQEISKSMIHVNGELVLSERGKRLAIQRARVVAAAKSKINTLKDIIINENLQKEKHMLVYCGAANLITEENKVEKEDLRQITNVIKMLGKELHMVVARFTSEEDIEERRNITEHFKNGDLQALVAIKCLDEGVNIPSIETAFILASTTNPKEYIQRRGRVLRLSKDTGKKYAKIYDFITLPTKLHQVSSLLQGSYDSELTLVKNEIRRAEEFARIADNYAEARKIIDEIKQQYHISNLGSDEWIM